MSAIETHADDFARSTSSEQRSTDLYHHIDAGFIHRRHCLNLLGPKAAGLIAQRPVPRDHFEQLALDHMVVRLVLGGCKASSLPTLADALCQPTPGTLFCSTEIVRGVARFWKTARPTNRILTPFSTKSVVLEYSKTHIVSDTLKSELSSGEHILSIVGRIREVLAKKVVIHPIIVGSPWLEHPLNEGKGIAIGELMFGGYNWFENFPADIDEFSKCASIPAQEPEEWQEVMKKMPERDVKRHLAARLGDEAEGDWGGEQHDHYSANVHLSKRRVTAAFLLKGPSRFAPMTPRMLGTNGDQIVRLASSSAHLLVVQHCHVIQDSVRLMLRMAAVAPHNPRRFCLIDGRDTFRILRAYGCV